jgi:MFS family permease
MADISLEKEAPAAGVATSDTTVAPAQSARSAWRLSLDRTFASFKYRNYRLWFIGQLASLVGTWMQSTAQGFLVFQLTHSAAYLGYVGFASGIPSLLFTLYGGVISDRMSRRTMMLITQTSMLILAFILAALTFAGVVQPWHILVLAFLLGIANAFDAPPRLAFVLELVDRKDMTNAIALNSMMFNAATAVGPAIAGIAYALFGPAWCFIINGISFIAVIWALLMMHLQPLPVRAHTSSTLVDLKDGLRYTLSHSVIRVLILVASVASLFGLGYVTLLPAWAVNVLHGDSTTNGFLQSARGVGALIGALMIASMGHFKFKGQVLTLGSFIFPILLLAFAVVRWVPLSLLLLVGVGWSFMMVLNVANALVQSYVPDNLRGRVMSIYNLGFMGMMPVGALLIGPLASATNEQLAVVVTAGLVLAFGVWLWVRTPQIRRLE